MNVHKNARLTFARRLEMVLDVTERKLAAEARYRRLFESARDGILIVDASTGEVMDLNPFAEQLLGTLAGLRQRGRQPLVHRFDSLPAARSPCRATGADAGCW